MTFSQLILSAHFVTLVCDDNIKLPKYETPASPGNKIYISWSCLPRCIFVEVAVNPPEVELEAGLRVRSAASLDGVDVIGEVVTEDGGPLKKIHVTVAQ